MADSIAHAVFSPEKLEVAMPDEHEDELTSPDPLEKISDSTWKPVTVSDFEVNLEAKSAGRGGRLTFEPWISKKPRVQGHGSDFSRTVSGIVD